MILDMLLIHLKIKKYINWIPKVEINTGLKKTINFYSKNYLK